MCTTRWIALALLVAIGCRSGAGTTSDGGGITNPRGGGGGNTADFSMVGRGAEQNQHFDLNPIRDLDLLFVVQNTPGMAAKQQALARALPGLFEELAQIPGGLPNLHVGVVSTDVGAGQRGTICTRPGGDRGIFQVGSCGLDSGTRFLSSFNAGANNNFPGKLADMAACLVQVGERGCEFSHALQAARVALYESVTPENNGFLRKDAFLQVVVLADRDDCSAETTSDLFDRDDPTEHRALRCSLAGHACRGAPTHRTAAYNATLSTCEASASRELIPVKEMVDSLRALKPRPDHQILLTVIGGWPADADTATYKYSADSGKLGEEPICTSALGPAWAGLRLRAAIEQLGNNGKLVSLCQPDLSEVMRDVGRSLHATLGSMCLSEKPVDADAATPGVQPLCQFVLREPGSAQYTDRSLPSCRDDGVRPCVRFLEEASCLQSGFRVELDLGGTAPAPGSLAWLRCAAAVPMTEPSPPMQCNGRPCTPKLGQTCDLGTPTPGYDQGVYRGDARECGTGVCLRPARDPAVALVVDTTATCTTSCNSDADCAGAELRQSGNPTDKRCRGGYACAVPFEVGPLCCRKLCVCKDFLPRTGARTPASCDPAVPASQTACPNRP